MHTFTQREQRLKDENFAYGYALYSANQDIERCTNNDQRDGYRAARKGALAADFAMADSETTAFLMGGAR